MSCQTQERRTSRGQRTGDTKSVRRPEGSRTVVRKLNEVQIDLLVKEYQDGKTVYELAARFGVSRGTVTKHVTSRGVKMRMQGLDPSDLPEVQRLRGEGLSFEKIGRRLGVCAGTVQRLLAKPDPGTS